MKCVNARSFRRDWPANGCAFCVTGSPWSATCERAYAWQPRRFSGDFLLAFLVRRSYQEADVEGAQVRSTNELAVDRTDLAARRTLMAADRSLMAWIRTSLSMISFGFTIYKILESFEEAGGHLTHPHSARRVGLFLTGMGTVSMVMGTIEYWRTLVDLGEYQHFGIWRPTFIVALIMAIAGSFMFMSIVIRLL
jgi:putative membrane protein